MLCSSRAGNVSQALESRLGLFTAHVHGTHNPPSATRSPSHPTVALTQVRGKKRGGSEEISLQALNPALLTLHRHFWLLPPLHCATLHQCFDFSSCFSLKLPNITSIAFSMPSSHCCPYIFQALSCQRNSWLIQESWWFLRMGQMPVYIKMSLEILGQENRPL